MSPVFIFTTENAGELAAKSFAKQAERKVKPSTHIPDLDNANVGTFVYITGNFQIGGSL